MKPIHYVVLLVIVVLLFGARRLPDLAKSVGQSLKIFKSEMKDLVDDDKAPSTPAAPTPAPQQVPSAPTTPPGTLFANEPRVAPGGPSTAASADAGGVASKDDATGSH